MRPFLLAVLATPVFAFACPSLAQSTSADPPHWLSQPSNADIVAVYPRKAARLGHYGRVVMNCAVMPEGNLGHCMISSEDPADEGFAEAALKLVKFYKLGSANSAHLPRTTVDVPIYFSLAP